jgi:ubiquinone/menaquinone biosynthesis C-methylase UbiE
VPEQRHDRRHATSWSSKVEGDRYERGRPGYPGEAGALLLAEAGAGPGDVVVDLAAGTGKLTRVLAVAAGPGGPLVVAVEPMEGMRRQLRAVLPDVPVLAGTAESMALRAGSVRAVTAAQAVHWFAWPAAADELRRVLAADGRLAIVTNGRDPAWPATEAVAEILARYESLSPRPASVRRWRDGFEVSGAFKAAGTHHLPHTQVFADEAAFDARFASVSFAILLPGDLRARMLADLHEAVARAGVDPLQVPLRTTVEMYRPVRGLLRRRRESGPRPGGPRR